MAAVTEYRRLSASTPRGLYAAGLCRTRSPRLLGAGSPLRFLAISRECRGMQSDRRSASRSGCASADERRREICLVTPGSG